MKFVVNEVLENRSRSFAGEDSPQSLRKRIDLLKPRDRLLIELDLAGTNNRKRIAALLGMTPSTVTRRLQRIRRRLSDPMVVRLIDSHCLLDGELRQMAVEHFLADLSVAEIAAKHGLAPAAVRRKIAAVSWWARGHAVRNPRGVNP